MSRLRSYGPMSKRSQKVEAGEAAFKAVYAEVDARSEGRCEVWEPAKVLSWTTGLPEVAHIRCRRRAVEHHHLYKPRRANHDASKVIHACRDCHDRMEWPYRRGRLSYMGTARGTDPMLTFLFSIRYAKPALGDRVGGHFGEGAQG